MIDPRLARHGGRAPAADGIALDQAQMPAPQAGPKVRAAGLLLLTACALALSPESSAAGIQAAAASPARQAAEKGEAVSLALSYSTDGPGTCELPGFGVRAHWSSKRLRFTGLSDLRQAGLLVPRKRLAAQDDTQDLDGDPSTDKLINLSWFDIDGHWPGAGCEAQTPLATLGFVAIARFGTVNLTVPVTALGYAQSSSGAQIGMGRLIVSPSSGLKTTEAGGTATFNVVLDPAPSAPVSIAVTSLDPSEGEASPEQLVFTPEDWDTERSVTVTGRDDPADDGDLSYGVRLGPAASADPIYDGRQVPDLVVLNRDDDAAGVVVTAATRTTGENGGAVEVSVRLTSQPSSTLTLQVASTEPGEGRPSLASLSFAPEDWSLPKTFSVGGIDDSVDDGDIGYFVEVGPAEGADPGYLGRSGRVALRNRDDDTAGVHVKAAKPLKTGEDGSVAGFEVSLRSQPTDTVTVPLESSDPGEGIPTPSSLTFGPADWRTPKSVRLTGLDDSESDGDAAYRVTLGPVLSADSKYGGIAVPDLTALNLDDEPPVLEIVLSGDGVGLVRSDPPGIDCDSTCPGSGTCRCRASLAPGQALLRVETQDWARVGSWGQCTRLDTGSCSLDLTRGTLRLELRLDAFCAACLPNGSGWRAVLP